MNKSDWRPVDIEYGNIFFQVRVPQWCDILKIRHLSPLKSPKKHIEYSLSNPIGSPPLEKLVATCNKPVDEIKVAITVSDNTRPVPYNSEREEGILFPLLMKLEKTGIRRKNIIIIVGTGTHVATSRQWKKAAFGRYIFDNYEILDHDCTSAELCSIGNIDSMDVKINRQFYSADFRIVTGLVEPHFMAGFSGGRKVVCPGLVNIETTWIFHGTDFMDDPYATNLVLKNNPCHQFALKVAKRAGVHFSINVVLNDEMQLVGLYTGDLEKAHIKAVKRVTDCAIIPVDHEYDIVLTHGGRVAVNHYQALKAAYSVIPIVQKGGTVILVAHNDDQEPVGKAEYKQVLRVLKEKGPGRFTEFIKTAAWEFVPDQWEVQKWDQFFQKIGSFDRLIYCTNGIPPEDLKGLPGKSGYDLIERGGTAIEDMVQDAVDYAVGELDQITNKPTMAFVREGPYAVPAISTDSSKNQMW